MILAALLLIAAADTVRVTGGDAAALRAAVSSGGADRVVIAGPGRYEGGLVLDRAVTLIGEAGAELWGGGLGTVLRITGTGVTVRGLRISGGGADLDRDDAGVRIEADSATLSDLVIADALHGVYLLVADHAVIRRVTIRGRTALNQNHRGDGVHFFRSNHAVAEFNDIADVRDGMYFSYSDTTLVRGNSVTRSRYGLHYMFSHANRFEHNSFTHSSAGSSIMNSRDVTAIGNLFAFNRGVASFGLLLQTTEGSVLVGNRFAGNAVGLFLDGVTGGTVSGNLVADNFVGIQLFQSTTNTTVTGNAIVGNTYPTVGGAPQSRFCDAGNGNYWSGDDGWDIDRDGAHDAPFRAGSPLTELSRERPALRLFLGSPASRVLEWAERTFPVFRIDTVEDDCPLAAIPDVPSLAGAAPPVTTARTATWLVAALALGLGGTALGLASRSST